MTAEFPPFTTNAQARGGTKVKFSICTMVTRADQYAEMVETFVKGGFSPADCEYLYVDNRAANGHDAYAAYNLFLTVAQGEHIILCHQDVFLRDDDRQTLEKRLAELTELDPLWAACGNAGGMASGKLAIRITDRYGPDQRTARFPARVSALDENFIVVRRDANLAVSHNLTGFHLYGADLCIIAWVLGRTTYAIDFHLEHTGEGAMGPGYYAIRSDLIAKYARAFRPRTIVSTTTHFKLSPSRLLGLLRSLKRILQRGGP